MKCHRTIGPSVVVVMRDGDGEDYHHTIHPAPRDCIGSECAMWTPWSNTEKGYCLDGWNPDGLGQAWPDPAKKDCTP